MDNEASSSSTLVCNLEGTLLKSPSFFPYYMLVALEAGGPLRALLLLLLFPLSWLLDRCLCSPTTAIRLQVFVSTAGLRYSEVRAVSRAVLPKFLLEDLHPSAYRALIHSSDAVVISSHPKVFLDHFLSVHLRVRSVIAADLLVSNAGVCTGLLSLSSPGFLDENAKLLALRHLFRARSSDERRPLLGLMRAGVHRSQPPHLFLTHCKDIVELPEPSGGKEIESVGREQYVSPLVFHDGRLVMRPTPFTCVVILLWMPIGIILAMTRIMIGLTVRGPLVYPITSLLGLRLRVKGAPPLLERPPEGVDAGSDTQREGVLFVCTHRTLADPTFLAMALRRKVRALAYSVSRVSEMITPIKATRLTRNREEDSKIIDELLKKEDVFVCPEGTTCREPFLLRFSPLFADLADRIVPVALDAKMSVFQGTTARGYKFLDGFFFLMNPRPSYEIAFLEPVPTRHLRSLGNTSIDIANAVQKQLAAQLGYQCTNFSRRDKYNLLAGNDGKA